MKQLFKSAVIALFGPQRSRRLAARLRGQSIPFSESDLILAHFEGHVAQGVMIDVGAHFGESFAPYLGKGWHVLAFEPDPANRAELLRRVDASRISLYDCAVSDREIDGVPFFASPESDGISSLSAFRDTHREVNRVRVMTLRKILQNEPLARVDFLKIDTEGHDLFVLQGFPWEQIMPEVVLCEFEDSKTLPLGYDHRDLGVKLLDLGYEVYLSEWAPIVRYGASHEWKSLTRFPCALNNLKGWGNFVAFKLGAKRNAVECYLRGYTK